MQNAILGMRTVSVSQGNFSNFTHKGINALDLVGEDVGKDVWRAKNRWKCTNVLEYNATGFANTCFFSPCDENGNLCLVNTPSGIKKLTIVLTHVDVLKVTEGKVYNHDDFIYMEGVKGNATGNHIHAEACFDWITEKVQLVGNQYHNGSTWATPHAVPLHEALFLLEGYNILNDKNYSWKWVNSVDAVGVTEQAVAQADEYTISYRGLSVHIGRISKDNDIRGSVDGNRFGKPYDKTISKGFSDKDLISQGYSEVFATNGSTFYVYDNQTFAEGMEISKGVNNQDFNMSCVSKFVNCMAMGFPKSGGIVFDYQRNLQTRTDLYGAVTGAFGIMKDGKMNIAGSEYNRGNCFTVRSGRPIWAEDDKNYYTICFKGVTGQTGLTGAELYDLVKTVSPTMISAICFDGGGSVFERINGKDVITTGRAVKNGVLLFAKAIVKPSVPVEKPVEPCKECEALKAQVTDLQEQLAAKDAALKAKDAEITGLKAERDKLQAELSQTRQTIQHIKDILK